MKKSTPKVYLCDTNTELVKFWQKYFHAFPEVEIVNGDIFNIKANAIVSPANSFGDMNGGIDLLYKNKFGVDVERLVQKNIELHWYDELPIGVALSVPLKNTDYKYLIVAPTMRVPMQVDSTLNAYQAFRAALLLAKDQRIESLVCPGLGTGTGKACVEMVARQMFITYIDVVHNIKPKKLHEITKQMIWMLRCSQDVRNKGV